MSLNNNELDIQKYIIYTNTNINKLLNMVVHDPSILKTINQVELFYENLVNSKRENNKSNVLSGNIIWNLNEVRNKFNEFININAYNEIMALNNLLKPLLKKCKYVIFGKILDVFDLFKYLKLPNTKIRDIEIENDMFYIAIYNSNDKTSTTSLFLSSLEHEENEKTDLINLIQKSESFKYLQQKYKIIFIKNEFKTCEEILLNINNPLYKFCYNSDGYFTGLLSFWSNLIMLKKNNLIMKNNIYAKTIQYDTNIINIHNIITCCDINKLKQFKLHNTLNFEQFDLYGFTPIENALILYSKYENSTLKISLVNIIYELKEYIYRRPPYILAKVLDLSELFGLVKEIKCKYFTMSDKKIEDIDKLIEIYEGVPNADMINTILMNAILDDISNETFILPSSEPFNDVNKTIPCESIIEIHENNFIDFINFIESDIKTSRGVLNILNIQFTKSINAYNIRKIVGKIIKHDKNKIDIAIVILYFGFINLLNELNFILDENFIKKFIKKYLLKLMIHENYISTIFLLKEYNPLVKSSCNTELLNDIYITLLNIYDKNHTSFYKFIKLFEAYKIHIHDNILHYFAKYKQHNLYDIIDYFNNINKMNIYRCIDSDKNTFIHILIKNEKKNKVSEILNDVIMKMDDKNILNIQNNYGETPIIISAKNYDERCINILFKFTNNNLCDIHGNTVYHYICMNNIMIGTTINNNIKNKYGFQPLDYTTLKQYWKVLT
jgi:hypothetical protein